MDTIKVVPIPSGRIRLLLAFRSADDLERAATCARGVSDRFDLELTSDPEVLLHTLASEDRDVVACDATLLEAPASRIPAMPRPAAAVVAPEGSAPARPGYATVARNPGSDPFAGLRLWLSGAAAAAARSSGLAMDLAKRYEDLVHALPDIVYELDPEGRFTFVNESISMLGYKPPELLGRHYGVLLHEEDAEAVDRDKILPEYLGHRTGLSLSPKLFNERRGPDRCTADLEVRLRRKPGPAGQGQDMIGAVISYGEVSAAGEYAKGGTGEFRGSVGIIRDITLRRKSEEMLRKLYQAVDQLRTCVFIVNHAFETEYVNPSFFMLTGFSPADVIGCSIFRFFAFLPAQAAEIRRHLQDGFDRREEVLVPRAKGGQFWASITLAPVRSPSGMVTHVIAIMEDISDRKTMEELLHSARAEAEGANMAKSRFLSSMTHELKNPISGIIAAARLLQDSDEDSGRRVEAILEHAQSLLDIMSGILDYVRSEGGDAPVSRLAFPLKAFMERLCLPYGRKAEAKGLGFSLAYAADETIEGDPDRLGRAIGILVDNAVKFTRNGSITVDATVERREGNVPHLRVVVRDTGIGIEAGDRERIFQPFTQLGVARGADARGAGIGLALARNILRALGGEIRLSSDPGTGSEFTLIVPAGLPTAAAPSGRVPFVLLVVDDNEVNLEYMRTLVENAGYRVLVAASAADAFGILDTHYVDGALLDILMPGYSGLELARAIREYSGARYAAAMPLFAMTAHDPREVEEADALFRAVFSKPTDVKKMLAAFAAAFAEADAVDGSRFASSFSGRDEERAEAAAALLDSGSAAVAALRSALRADGETRVDVHAEADRIVACFKRLGCDHGVDMARLFVEHYSGEDQDVLEGLLQRVESMLAAGFADRGKAADAGPDSR